MVSERADVSTRRAFDGKTGDRAFDVGEAVFEEFDGSGPELDGLILASEFVSGAARDFFGGENRGHLVEGAQAFPGELFESIAVQCDGNFGSLRRAFGVVGVCGVAEAKASGVALAAARVEANEACGFP